MKKLTKILLCVAIPGIACLVASCHKDSTHYNMTNQDFVTKASSSNMFEIAAGNLALHNSTNADVQAFGNHMITDHGQAGTEMAALAVHKGWNIPSAMLQKDQDNLNALSALTGTAFDRQFAATMVVSHQLTIDLFQSAAENDGVPDADLRSFSSAKLPTLNAHLQDSQQLQDKVGH